MLSLVTDIGGTNARVALVNRLHIEAIRVYPTNEFKRAADLFTKFQNDMGQKLPSRWAVAAAGVLTEDRIQGTNINWDIVRDELMTLFHLKTCLLLNDFEAAAYGLSVIKRQNLVQIGGKSPKDNCTKILIGAGTGLGEAICVFCPNGQWNVLRTEGGHCSFAPTNLTEIKLLTFLQSQNDQVSYERILSGTGLLNLYKFFLNELTNLPQNSDIAPKLEKPSQVTLGAKKGDPVCQKAIDLFCRIYGEEAGNFALKTLPEGGVFIGGGIALHILDWLKKGAFRKGFESKEKMGSLLQAIPVFVVNEPYLGIYGGAYKLLQTSMPKAA